MATFTVRVHTIRIEPHPNADAIELARVGDFLSIVRKGQFQNGDLAAYIPEQALVPDAVLAELGLVGKLTGPAKNRVKALKLRGILSQGLIFPARVGWAEDDDVADELGITKYEPAIPTQMAGAVWAAGFDRTLRYDIENAKAFPGVFVAGEPVVATEKIHGTWISIGVMPPDLADSVNGDVMVASKGMAGKGLAFLADSAENEGNLYLRAARAHRIVERMRDVLADVLAAGKPAFVLGEVFGSGVQDLAYGHAAGSDETLGVRIFDMYVGNPGHGRYLDDHELDREIANMGLQRVPTLYRGPFDAKILADLAEGRETVSGRGLHIREGIVVRTAIERQDQRLGRVQLKMINERYLLRDGGTEFQ
jgi:RNA ligase (TIGR02306 family)